MKKKMVILFILSMIFLFLFNATVFTGCKAKDTSNKIRIAYFPNMTHGQAILGMAQNSFADAFGEDYEVTFINFNAGPSEIEAFFADEVDIGYIGPIPAINGFARSLGDIKIIAGATNAGAVLITREDLKLSSVKDLENKKIAIPQFGNTQHLALLSILSENGLKTADKGGNVTVTEAANPDIKTLMDIGEIDAACLPEPWGTRIVNEINANILLDYDELLFQGNYSTAVVIASDKFLKNHPELAEIFLRVHIDLTEQINADENDNNNSESGKESSETIINKKIEDLTKVSLDGDILNEAFGKIVFSYDPAVSSIKEYMQIYVSEVSGEEIKNQDELFDFSLLNKILRERGWEEVKNGD